MNFKEEMTHRITWIEEVNKRFLPEENGYQKTLFEAMNYSVLAGGKRIRPMLMLETYRLFGGVDTLVLEPFIAAIEMIHTYSLVHDDLPAIDNDEYRRGRKTTHVVYGEDMAILAGDGLLNYAYEVACSAFDHTKDYKTVADALKILTSKPGIYGMIGGQVVDVQANNKQVEKDKLDFIYRLKTGALIEASMLIGATLAGASKEKLNIIGNLALDVGLAFQIQDDILDVTSTTQTLGKPVQSDMKNHKTTYVTIEGIEKAKEDVENISNRALLALESLTEKNEFLYSLIKELITREK